MESKLTPQAILNIHDKLISYYYIKDSEQKTKSSKDFFDALKSISANLDEVLNFTDENGKTLLHVVFEYGDTEIVSSLLPLLSKDQIVMGLSKVDVGSATPLERLLFGSPSPANILSILLKNKDILSDILTFKNSDNQTLFHLLPYLEDSSPIMAILKEALKGQEELWNTIKEQVDVYGKSIQDAIGEKSFANINDVAKSWNTYLRSLVPSFNMGIISNINVPFRLQGMDIKTAISSFISKLPSITSSNNALGDASNPAKPSADQIEPQKISLARDDSGVYSIYANATIAHNNLVLPKAVDPEATITEKINDAQTGWGYFTGGVNNLAQGFIGYFAVRFNNNVSELAERSLNSTIEGQTPIIIPTLYPQNAYFNFKIYATTPDSEKLYDPYAAPIESRRDAIVNASVGAVGADVNARTYQEQKERIDIAKEAYEQKKNEENREKENINNYIGQARKIIDAEQPDLNQAVRSSTATGGESDFSLSSMFPGSVSSSANPTPRLLEDERGLPPRVGVVSVSPSPSAASTPRLLEDERGLPPRLGFPVSSSSSAASTPRSLGDESDSPRLRLFPVSPSSSANPRSRLGLLSLKSPIGSPIARKMAAQNILEEKRVLLDQAKATLESVTSESERIDNLLNSQYESTELRDILEISNLVRQSLHLSLRKRDLNNEMSRLQTEISELEILEAWLESPPRPSSLEKGNKTPLQKINKQLEELRPLISAIEGQKIDPDNPGLSKRQIAELKRLADLKSKRGKLLQEKREIEPSEDDVSQECRNILEELGRVQQTDIIAERRQKLLEEFSPKFQDIDLLQSLLKESTELSLEFKGLYQAERMRASIFDFASGISTIIHYDEVIFKQLNVTPPQEYYDYVRPGLAIFLGFVQAAAGRDVTHLYNGLLQSRLIDRGVNSVISDSANEQELKLAADLAAHVVLPVLGRTAGMVYANRGVPSFEMWHKGIPGKMIALATAAALGTNYVASKMGSQVGYGIAMVSNMFLHANTFLNGGKLVKLFEGWNAVQVISDNDWIIAKNVIKSLSWVGISQHNNTNSDYLYEIASSIGYGAVLGGGVDGFFIASNTLRGARIGASIAGVLKAIALITKSQWSLPVGESVVGCSLGRLYTEAQGNFYRTSYEKLSMSGAVNQVVGFIAGALVRGFGYVVDRYKYEIHTSGIVGALSAAYMIYSSNKNGDKHCDYMNTMAIYGIKSWTLTAAFFVGKDIVQGITTLGYNYYRDSLSYTDLEKYSKNDGYGKTKTDDSEYSYKMSISAVGGALLGLYIYTDSMYAASEYAASEYGYNMIMSAVGGAPLGLYMYTDSMYTASMYATSEYGYKMIMSAVGGALLGLYMYTVPAFPGSASPLSSSPYPFKEHANYAIPYSIIHVICRPIIELPVFVYEHGVSDLLSYVGLTHTSKAQAAIRQDHYNTPLENYRLGFASPLATHIHCGRGEISANMAYFGSEVRNELKHMAREFNTPLERFGLQYFVDTKLGYIATSEAIALMAVAASFVVPISPLVIGVGLISSSGAIGSAIYALYQGTKRVDLSHKSPEERWCSSTSSGGEDLGLENNGQRVVCHAWKNIKSKLKVNDAEMLQNNFYPESISPKQAQDYLEGVKQGKHVTTSMRDAGITARYDVCTQDGGMLSNLNKAIESVFCSKLIYQSSPCTIDTFIDYINGATPQQITLMAHEIAQNFAGEGASVVHDEV